jgi:hypothetical protein
LLGGSLLSTAEITAFQNFVNTIRFQPNPNQNMDRTLPAQVPISSGEFGDPNNGKLMFSNAAFGANLRCSTCHTLPGTGTNRVIIDGAITGISQPMKVPHLRNIYQKLGFRRNLTEPSLAGFGLAHDGIEPGIDSFLSRPFFGPIASEATAKRDLAAFLLCFDTGTAPSVGATQTVTSNTLSAFGVTWSLLEGQAAAGNCDLTVQVRTGTTVPVSYTYRPAPGMFAIPRVLLCVPGRTLNR